MNLFAYTIKAQLNDFPLIKISSSIVETINIKPKKN
jgi:hypothetical protein